MRYTAPLLALLVGASVALAGTVYTADLSGDQVVPPVATAASGDASFRPSRDLTELKFKVMVADIYDPFACHIFEGAPGENGPTVTTLYNDPKRQGLVQGVLCSGTLTAADLEGAWSGKTMAEFIGAMARGQFYLTVSTGAYPEGEIRGQIQ